MNGANLQLSEAEMKLVTDAEWILTKNSILAKVVALMAELSEDYKRIWPMEGGGKISRGEQCEGLPYVMLDYPRIFGKEDILAVRTFFWWGKGWQLILHMKGRYLREREERIIAGLGELDGFMMATEGDEWAHGVERYEPLGEGSAERIRRAAWCKIMMPVGMKAWGGMRERMCVGFERVGRIVNYDFGLKVDGCEER